MKIKSLLFFLPALALLASCGDTPQTPQGEEYETYILNFNSSYVARSNSESSGFKAAMLSYINHDADIASEVTINAENYINIYGKSDSDVKRLILGSATKDGEMIISFKTKLVSLKIEAQAQYSSYNRTWDEYDDEGQLKPKGYIINNDNTANKVYINGSAWNLNYGNYGEVVYQSQSDLDSHLPEIKTNEFQINSNSLSLKGFAKERACIYKLEFKVVK